MHQGLEQDAALSGACSRSSRTSTRTQDQRQSLQHQGTLGLDADENGLWRQGAGLTVFATFESETDYFGSRAQRKAPEGGPLPS